MAFPNGSKNLSDAQGYSADIMRIMQSTLNFTSTIVETQGFGSQTSNGSWTGMVGVLDRRVSAYWSECVCTTPGGRQMNAVSEYSSTL